MAELVQTIVLEPGQTLAEVLGLEPNTAYDIEIVNVRDGLESDAVTLPLTTPDLVPAKPVLSLGEAISLNRNARRTQSDFSITFSYTWEPGTEPGRGEATAWETQVWTDAISDTGWTERTADTRSVNISVGNRSAGGTGYVGRAGVRYNISCRAKNSGGISETDTITFVVSHSLEGVGHGWQGYVSNLQASPSSNSAVIRFDNIPIPSRQVDENPAYFEVAIYEGAVPLHTSTRTLNLTGLTPIRTVNVLAFTTGTTFSSVISNIYQAIMPTTLAARIDGLSPLSSYTALVTGIGGFASADSHQRAILRYNNPRYVEQYPGNNPIPPSAITFNTTDVPVRAPINVIAEAITHTSITMEWTKRTGGGVVVTYLAELSSDETFPSGAQTTQVTVNESSESTFQTTFRGLSVDTQYYMRVTARNADGDAVSDVVPVTTLPQPILLPAPPTNIRFSSTTYNSFSASFTASAVSTENSAADTYTWEVSTSQAFTEATTVSDTITDLSDLSFSVSDLIPNRYYFVRVRANNEAGAGGYVTNTNTTRAIPVPGQVAFAPSVTDITPNEATVSWTRPSGIIEGYTLTLTGEEQPITYGVEGAGTLNFDLAGLSSQTDFSVTVAAYNGTGTGTASSPATFTTLPDIAPVLTTTETATNSIDFTWTTGTLFGDSWTFEYKLATATDWIVASQEIEGEAYTLEGLTEFTQYNARVKNNAGDIYSSATAVFTSASSITPPTLTHTGNRNRANTAALILTGGSLSSGTYYWRYRIRGAGGYPATWTTVSLSTNRYSFTTTEWAAGQQVQVEGRRGTRGPWSNRLEFISFNPYIRVSDITPTSVVLHAGGGNPADSTTDIQQLTPPSTWTTLTSQTRTLAYTVSDLTPDTEYSFRARRNNENSLTLTIRTTEAGSVAPGAPTALAMRNLDNLTGTLTWTKGTGVVTSYTAQISTQQSFADALRIVEFTIDDGDATTYRFPDNTFLTHTTNYLRLIANNAVGSSAPATFTIPTPQPASAVGPNLRTAGLATIIQMRFDGGDPSTDALIVEWTPALSATQPRHTIVYDNSVRLAATATTHNITGLNRASRYWVSIRREFGPATVVYVQTV